MFIPKKAIRINLEQIMVKIQILFNMANKLKSIYILKGVNENGYFM